VYGFKELFAFGLPFTEAGAEANRRRGRAWTILLVTWAAYLALIAAMTFGYPFDPQSGVANSRVMTVDGKYVLTSAIYNPRTGQKNPMATPELMHTMELQGLSPDQSNSVPVNPNGALFRSDGSPLYWCSKDPNGGYYLYTHDGFCVHTGQKLVPIDTAIATDIIREARAKGGAVMYRSGEAPSARDYETGDGLIGLRRYLEAQAKSTQQ